MKSRLLLEAISLTSPRTESSGFLSMGFFRTGKDIFIGAVVGCVSHPLRTILSGLAVAVAVSTVAFVLTGIEGFKNFAEVTGARTFGSDTFVITKVVPGELSRKELADKLLRNPSIKSGDVRFLRRYSQNQVHYAPIAQRRVDIVSGSNKFEAASLNGTSSEMFNIRDLGISQGRFFMPHEDLAASQVAVLGAEVAEILFPYTDPVGKKVRIAGRGFWIVGVQAIQGAGSALDRYVWIPIRAFERIFGPPESYEVFSKAVAPADFSFAEAIARVTMRARRQLRPGEEDNFDILSPEAARGFVLQLAQRIGAAAGPISAMALLAAIVVVTNTTLVSVSERTREIGIRRAIGATRRRIISEVLAESTLVALLGGGAGLLIATAVLQTGGRIISFDLDITLDTSIWSLGSAGLSGLLAGFYPAIRAAQTEVISALRVE
jgi:putative ABC transport system permease protein